MEAADMVDTGNEEELKRLLKSVYHPVNPPPEVRECLRERLALETAGGVQKTSPAWGRPRNWLPVAVGVISAVIGYGAWLSLNLAPMLMR